jgi:hypothetical protein
VSEVMNEFLASAPMQKGAHGKPVPVSRLSGAWSPDPALFELG